MSLTQEAIKEISNLTMAGRSIEAVTAAATPLALLPKDSAILSLEQYQNLRTRFRGNMETGSIPDFVKYSLDKQSSDVFCFVNHENMEAQTIFNLGSLDEPGHADNTATLSLVKTADYEALLGINGRKFNQKSLAEWLEDWRLSLTAIDPDGKDLEFKKAIAAVRKITIEATRSAEHEDQDFKSTSSVFENVEAKSKDILPAAFEFNCIPYSGLSPRAFYLRLSVLTGDEKPVFVLRIIKLESVVDEITNEFKNILVDQFDDSLIKTFIGTFSANK